MIGERLLVKNELYEIESLEKKISTELKSIKKGNNDINKVKALKNNIYEKTSKIFMYNLKKLIQLETTQKNLARKIGVSEDLLSKYKTGEAFPSIETLLYISEVYNIKYDQLITKPLTISELEVLGEQAGSDLNLFERIYYTYFFVTNKLKDKSIHEGSLEFSEDAISFKILSNNSIVKEFTGSCSIHDKLIYFELKSHNDGNAYINMIRPNVNKSKYIGGAAMLILPSDAASKPCAQKILISKVRIDRDENYSKLKDLLSFSDDKNKISNIKISYADDELAYEFIEKNIIQEY